MNLRTIAIRNINRRKGKVVLIFIGLSLAVATLVSIISIVYAFRNSLDQQLNDYGFNIAVFPRTNRLSLNYSGVTISGVTAERIRPLSDGDMAKIKAVANKRIRVMSPKVLQVVDVKGRPALLAGVDFRSERRIKRWWDEGFGLFPKERDELMVGDSAAQKLNIKAGDKLTLGLKEFRVSGILFPTGSQDDDLIFGDFETVRSSFSRGQEINLIEIAAEKSDDVDPLTSILKRKLPRATVTSIKQAVKYKENAMDQLLKFGLAVTGVVVFISALIVFTTMASSVNERRQEIGIFRAVGYRQSKIAAIIFTEAVLISLTSGVSGYMLGFVIAWVVPLIDKTFKVTVTPNILLLLMSVAMSVMIALAASIVPAWRAANLDPVESLKYL